MDEARRVLERLERIEALRGEAATTADLLAELRGLITDGERWLAAEAAGGTGKPVAPSNAVAASSSGRGR